MSEAASSFSTMAGAAAEGEAPEIGVRMLGYAFMGKAHSNAFKTIPYMMYPPVAIPKLVAISGRNESAVAEAGRGNEGVLARRRLRGAALGAALALRTTPARAFALGAAFARGTAASLERPLGGPRPPARGGGIPR